jgi:hypothetical protein
MATDVSTALPEVILAPGCTLTVDSGNAAAIITKLNVYGFSPVTREPIVIDLVPPILAYEPRGTTEAPALTP